MVFCILLIQSCKPILPSVRKQERGRQRIFHFRKRKYQREFPRDNLQVNLVIKKLEQKYESIHPDKQL